MKKNLYVIFDCKANTFGEVMSFENDDEAKRSFILSLVSLPNVLSDDLSLYKVGTIEVGFSSTLFDEDRKIGFPFLNVLEMSAVSDVVCTSSDVAEEVKQFQIRNVEFAKISSEIHVNYSAKKFVENVEKLSRYFAKKDKRFNK